jgi:endo-alpha-1,4-polygalactosaminidase (GH114 family)
MATLKLKISDRILDKVLWLLGQFKSEDVEIIQDEESTEENRRYVRETLQKLEQGKSRVYSMEALDDMLEKTIKAYED